MARLGRFPAGRGWPKGKLAEAARAWVFALLGRSDPGKPLPLDEAIAADFAELGVMLTDEEMDEEDVFEIWDINVAAFEVFRALDTQWHCVALSTMSAARLVRTGLDYTAVEIVMRRQGLPDDQFALIQAMEQAALDAYTEAAQ